MRIVTPTPQRFVSVLGRAGARPTVDADGAIVVKGLSSSAIGELAAGQALTLHELTPVRASLEDVFMELTSDSVEYRSRSPTPCRRRRAGDERTDAMTIAVPTDTRHWRSGLGHAMRAEWAKLTSLRSTKVTVLVTVAGTLLVTWLSSRSALHHPRQWYQGFDPTAQSLNGLLVGSLAIGVLGVLAMTGEYGSGTIRSSLAAVPRRGVFMAAKVLVVGLCALVIAEVLSFASFFFGQAILSGGAPTAALNQPGVLRAIVLSGVFLALFALLGLGLGAIIRHTAGASPPTPA